MKHYLLFLVGLFIVIFWASTPILSASEQTCTGRIVMMDPKLDIFIVKDKKSEKTFHVDPDSTIMIDGERKLFGELQKGETVTVIYNGTER